MKKILLLFFLSLLSLSTIRANITWSLSDDGTLTISGTDMPDYNDNGGPWYYQKEKIKKVEIKDGVTNIGGLAFYSCHNLTSITIPNSVTSIGFRTFESCSGLTSITIPNSVTSIGNGAFYACTGLTSVTIPNSVTSIEENAFGWCSGLTSITIPNTVTGIGPWAFYSCFNLTSITIPNSVTYIGSYAFYRCGLTSITNLSTIPQTVFSGTFSRYGTLHVLPGCKEAYQNADYWKNFTIVEDATDPNKTIYYTSKDGKIVTPYSISGFGANIVGNTYENGQGIITFDGDVTTIGEWAFFNSFNLVSITVPNSVTSIEDCAFAYCESLTSITIPNSVTSIGKSAFEDCDDLTSITIPNSVTSIGDKAFLHCTDLTSIVVDAQNANYDSRNNCNAIIETSTNTLLKGCKNTVIPNSVTSIGDWAFNYCSDLTSITIPNSVTSIGYAAFFSCRGLTSITIPNYVTSIGDHAFQYCESLTSVTIPNSVTSIGEMAFFHCYNLASITIPNSVTSIGDKAFYNCSGELSVTNLSTIPQRISDNTFLPYGTLHVLPGCKEAYQNADYWKNFTIVEDAIDPYPIELADGKTYNGATTQENKEISYTRTFNNTSWQSLYIPFSMTYDDWKDDFEVAYINGIRQMDTDDDGAIDETIMDVVKIKSGSLIPNIPYLIKAKTTGNKTITVNDATLYKAESNSVDCSTTIAKYTFTGTYSTIPAATLLANNYYAMGGGKLIMTDGTSDLKPFRWYLNVESRSPMYNVSSGAKAITINVVGEEEATGISQMPSDRENSSAIYDLNGRRMSQKTLKSGLYIKNGKKIIIK